MAVLDRFWVESGGFRLTAESQAPGAILRAYPPLIRRLARDRDASSAAFLAGEAVYRAKAEAQAGRKEGERLP